jgi:serine/threonine protein kinase
MGVVYEALDLDTGGAAAVKILRPDWRRVHEVVDRFRREICAVGRLRHRNLVSMIDAGSHEGLPFFAMQRLTGPRLDDLLVDGPLESDDAARLARGVACGLVHAHSRRVVHRDVKPANILVTPSQRGGRPILIDFGLARVLGEPRLGCCGGMLGTPYYMSPEQACGRSVEAGPQSDVYSLAATLYEMLTGAPPFSGDVQTVISARIRGERPVPPRELRSEVSPALSAITMKGLRNSPENRYASAAAFARDLERYLRRRRGSVHLLAPARLSLGRASYRRRFLAG